MKILVLCFFACLVSCSAFAAEQIKVETKFISADVAVPHDFAKLFQMHGVDLLASPGVTTKPGQAAAISVQGDQLVPGAVPGKIQSIPTGITCEVTPDLVEGRISYNVHVTVRDLVGVKDTREQTVAEAVSHELYLSGITKGNEGIWIELADDKDGKKRVLWLQFTRQDS